jgi:hypothetical protein
VQSKLHCQTCGQNQCMTPTTITVAIDVIEKLFIVNELPMMPILIAFNACNVMGS